MRYHLIPVRLAIIKRTKDNKCSQGCAETGTLTCILLVEMYNDVASMENSMRVPQKIKNFN